MYSDYGSTSEDFTFTLYDEFGRVNKSYPNFGKYPLRYTQTSYDKHGNVEWTRDIYGQYTYYYYDLAGRQKYVNTPGLDSAANRRSVSYTYDTAGRVTIVAGPFLDTDKNGVQDNAQEKYPVQVTNYDAHSNVETSYTYIYTESSTYYNYVRYCYNYKNQGGAVVQVTTNYEQDDETITWYNYNTYGQLDSTIVDPTDNGGTLNLVSKYYYDNLGRAYMTVSDDTASGANLVSETKWIPHTNLVDESYTYKEGYSANKITNVKYTYYDDYSRRVWKVTDALGNTTETAYFSGGMVRKTKNALGGEVNYRYNSRGQVTEVYDENNDPDDANPDFTSYVYDSLGRLTQTVDPLENSAYVHYSESFNRVDYVTDANGQEIGYLYDYMGRQNRIDINNDGDPDDDGDRLFDFNHRGQVWRIREVDSTMRIRFEYEFDSLGRVITIDDQYLDKEISYTYYNSGKRKTMTDPESNVQKFYYDGAGRLTRIDDGSDDTLLTYFYNGLSQRTHVYRGTDTNYEGYTVHRYDDYGRLVSLANYKSDGTTVISAFAYTLDKIGNRVKMYYDADGDGDGSADNDPFVEYGYDGRYQLTLEKKWEYESGQYVAKWSNGYTYDSRGNRVEKLFWDGTDTDNTTYVCNAYNQLEEEVVDENNDDTIDYKIMYEYNKNGSMKRHGRYVWQNDQWIELTAFAGGYTYNELGQLSVMTRLETQFDFEYDVLGRRNRRKMTTNLGVQYDEKYFYDGNDIIADYDGDDSDAFLRRYVTPGLDQVMMMANASDTWYYYHDGLGSVRELVNSSGTIMNSYDYYAFGETLSETETVYNRYKYTGREQDFNDHYHYRARSYKPSIGRFGQKDPLPNTNLYRYVNNNPINYVDPYGLVTASHKIENIGKTNLSSKVLKNHVFAVGKHTDYPGIPYQMQGPWSMTRIPEFRLEKQHKFSPELFTYGHGLDVTIDFTPDDSIKKAKEKFYWIQLTSYSKYMVVEPGNEKKTQFKDWDIDGDTLKDSKFPYKYANQKWKMEKLVLRDTPHSGIVISRAKTKSSDISDRWGITYVAERTAYEAVYYDPHVRVLKAVKTQLPNAYIYIKNEFETYLVCTDKSKIQKIYGYWYWGYEVKYDATSFTFKKEYEPQWSDKPERFGPQGIIKKE